MADVLVVGDGPGGLSAALLLAKNGQNVTVFGIDGTPMHKAVLYNYLGIPEITGDEFQRIARQQVEAKGAKLIDAEVTSLGRDGGAFAVTADGETHQGKYLILAAGSKRDLADGLGVDRDDDGAVRVDREARTSVAGCYALGWMTKRHRTQAIISAGEGAAAALDILSTEMGKDFHDFDVVDDG